jgi:hypothetical protein
MSLIGRRFCYGYGRKRKRRIDRVHKNLSSILWNIAELWVWLPPKFDSTSTARPTTPLMCRSKSSGNVHTHARTHAHAHAHTRTVARTHTHTHTHIVLGKFTILRLNGNDGVPAREFTFLLNIISDVSAQFFFAFLFGFCGCCCFCLWLLY